MPFFFKQTVLEIFMFLYPVCFLNVCLGDMLLEPSNVIIPAANIQSWIIRVYRELLTRKWGLYRFVWFWHKCSRLECSWEFANFYSPTFTYANLKGKWLYRCWRDQHYGGVRRWKGWGELSFRTAHPRSRKISQVHIEVGTWRPWLSCPPEKGGPACPVSVPVVGKVKPAWDIVGWHRLSGNRPPSIHNSTCIWVSPHTESGWVFSLGVFVYFICSLKWLISMSVSSCGELGGRW